MPPPRCAGIGAPLPQTLRGRSLSRRLRRFTSRASSGPAGRERVRGGERPGPGGSLRGETGSPQAGRRRLRDGTAAATWRRAPKPPHGRSQDGAGGAEGGRAGGPEGRAGGGSEAAQRPRMAAARSSPGPGRYPPGVLPGAGGPSREPGAEHYGHFWSVLLLQWGFCPVLTKPALPKRTRGVKRRPQSAGRSPSGSAGERRGDGRAHARTAGAVLAP